MDLNKMYRIKYMNFGQAIEALKEGRAVQRADWNDKGIFVIKQIPAIIRANFIPDMQSLPQEAKNILMSKKVPEIKYTNQMLIIDSDGVANSWIPSSSDIFAEDWQLYYH